MLEGKYEKNRVPKIVKLTLSRNMSKQKQSENDGKRTQKMQKKNELKRNPKRKKRVEMKMKRNKEGRPKQNWSLTR